MTRPGDPLEVLRAAIAEVAEDRASQRKLARAATTRAHCEMEWVYEIFGTRALEEYAATREAPLGGRARADLTISGVHVEFKSTQAHFAVEGAFDGTAAKRDLVVEWLGKDLRRSAQRAGCFVLIVSTVRPPDRSSFATTPVADIRHTALSRYVAWLSSSIHEWPPPVSVHCEPGGSGAYAGRAAIHDLIIASWIA